MVEPFATVFWNGRPPDQILSICYASDANWNESKYSNPTVDQLIVQARGQSLEERKVTYGEIQRILVDEVPRTVVAFQPILFGVRTDVRGVQSHPMSWLILNDAWLDR
jgi:peptide/nickel transport system substrate-binding protein